MKVSIINPQLIDDETLELLLSTLPSWRKEVAMRYKFRQGRLESALSYHLLTLQLGYQPVFAYGKHGKPTIDADEPLKQGYAYSHFNVSHCKTAVACAVGKGPVGVDVECLGRYSETLAAYTMNDEELGAIQEADDPDTTFTILWTKKEALLKLTGEGITDDLKTVLHSDRTKGIKIQSGYDKEQKYAWSVAFTSFDDDPVMDYDAYIM